MQEIHIVLGLRHCRRQPRLGPGPLEPRTWALGSGTRDGGQRPGGHGPGTWPGGLVASSQGLASWDLGGPGAELLQVAEIAVDLLARCRTAPANMRPRPEPPHENLDQMRDANTLFIVSTRSGDLHRYLRWSKRRCSDERPDIK